MLDFLKNLRARQAAWVQARVDQAQPNRDLRVTRWVMALLGVK